jgi:transposase
MNERRVVVGRDEWTKRVERWKDSGLTAKEFAGELGINPNSLHQWAYQLRKTTTHEPVERVGRPPEAQPQFVEITPPAAPTQTFDVRVGRFSVAVPSRFDEGGLLRLLKILGSAQ